MAHVKNKNSANRRLKKEFMGNSKREDASAKIIFNDPILFAQFIRGYSGIALLQDVQPEDIEDVTDRFVHMFTEERNSDVVKKVRLKQNEMPFYLISLVEHKSKVDYNTIMQILRYMVFIWEDYEKEQERLHPGVSKKKDFQYPPILPIIYYTGSTNWTAAVKLSERVYLSDILSEYIPNFRCILVQVKDFSNFQLMEKQDELSILMMINKMHKSADFSRWKEEVDPDYLEHITEQTPEYLLGVMAHMIELLLKNINVPGEEAENVAGKVKERDMAGLFDHFEKYDVQATRAEARRENAREVYEKLIQRGFEEAEAAEISGYTEQQTQGGSKERKALLKYMEESTLGNAVDEDLRKLQGIVDDVKSRPELEENYMTMQDIIDIEKENSYEDGRAEGHASGLAEGVIAICKSLGQDKEQTIEHLINQFQLTHDQAEEYLNLHW